MDKNLKDSGNGTDLSIRDTSFSISYNKTQKLVTALYMVTDIIERDEPIRNKLRMLGLEVLSDTATVSRSILDTKKIDQIMSFLNIASSMTFISEMNCAILTKEFLELKGSIQGYRDVKPKWLEEFLQTPSPANNVIEKDSRPLSSGKLPLSKSAGSYKGHTRIGVQKGGTLMKVLSDKTHFMSDRNYYEGKSDVSGHTLRANDFDILKKQRRSEIIKIIKDNEGSAAIKDIRIKINIEANGPLSFSEKTLQRELMSMTKDGVLNKTGDKRWSRYFLKN